VDRLAVIDPERSYTYGQLAECVGHAAACLRDLGVAPGDRVVHLGLTGCGHTVFLFAAARLGALYVPLDSWLMPAALDRLLGRVEPKVILLGKSLMQRPLAEELRGSHWRIPDGIEPVDLAAAPWQEVFGASGPCAPPPSPVADVSHSPCLMLFSSGTTGEPKGIVFSQESLVLQAMVINLGLGIGPLERYLNVYQASHYGGITCSVQTVAAGACLVNLPLPYPDAILKCIQDRKITFLVAVPAIWRGVLAHPAAPAADFSSLRMANVASDFIPPELMTEIMDRCGAVSVQGYGLSECGLVTLLPAPEARSRLGSAGIPLPLAAVQTRRPDGPLAAAGEEGEIWARTAYAAEGLWTDKKIEPPQLDAEGFAGTGDLGHLDEAGYLYVSGRSEDFMKVSGYRVSPAEIEAVLVRHPKVADAAVFPVDHPTLGQAPVAAIVVGTGGAPPAGELAARVAHELTPQAVPVQFVVAARIERTEATGKVRRREMRERFTQGQYVPLPS